MEAAENRTCSLPNLLALRQEFGLHQNPRTKCTLSRRELASKGAWNVRRLQNMILAVGPITASAKFMSLEEKMELEDDGNNDFNYMGGMLQEVPSEEGAEGGHRFVMRNLLLSADGHLQMPLMGGGGIFPRRSATTMWPVSLKRRSSIRHGGCINAAAWLECPWRLTTNRSIQESTECPTQCMTSGDDRIVKFWDVRDSMGYAAPRRGGWDTFLPFSSTGASHENTVENWFAEADDEERECILPGSVLELASFKTKHLANVFHLTPLNAFPGKFLSSGADGCLYLGDLVSESSKQVVGPDSSLDMDMTPADMIFSHHMLTADTGLLCSDRGLYFFDIRLRHSEQMGHALFDHYNSIEKWRSHKCKACLPWSPLGLSEEVGTHFAFVGGASETVCLLDLRISGDTTSRVVERYKPLQMSPHSSGVEVSGLDVSKDGRDLLVSYEGDQIYVFPILGSSGQGSLKQEHVEDCVSASAQSPTSRVSESARHLGHLNRSTFLKSAKFAGPNDEYICTGSDSGHAWIYKRKQNFVAALLGADNSICNGIVPHPSLPYFLTYGIESTAKLWRATPPIDWEADDSGIGRYKTHLTRPYEMSLVTKSTKTSQKLLNKYLPFELMPDFLPSRQERVRRSFSEPPSQRGLLGTDSESCGNALLNLPSLLRRNHFECVEAERERTDAPINTPVTTLMIHVGLTRLFHQAFSLGLTEWKPLGIEQAVGFHPADLVPDYPSDGIFSDPSSGKKGVSLSLPSDVEGGNVTRPVEASTIIDESNKKLHFPWLVDRMLEDLMSRFELQEAIPENLSTIVARQVQCEIALLCKEGGNDALKHGLFDLAARRYDKAILCCSISFLKYTFPENTFFDPLLVGYTKKIYHENGGPKRVYDAETEVPDLNMWYDRSSPITWSPLFEILITSRLNLALLFLRKEMLRPKDAACQAQISLLLLRPFWEREGEVVLRDEAESNKVLYVKKDEPPRSYALARSFATKAYFRHGCAHMEVENYEKALLSFGHCERFLSNNDVPQALFDKKVAQAKRFVAKAKKGKK